MTHIEPKIEFSFRLQKGVENIPIFSPGGAYDVHEYCRLDIYIESDESQSVTLQIGDFDVKLDFQNGGYRANGITPFANTLGTTHFNLVIDGVDFESRAINVFGSKLTYEKATGYLKFLSEESPELSQLCFSSTKMGSDGEDTEIDIISRKLEAGINALNFLVANAARFKADPIFIYVPETRVQPYQKHTPIDAASVSYLASNPDQLIKSNVYNSDVILNNRHFAINNLARQHARKNLDIYENQVILAFIQHFYRFLNNANEVLINSNRSKVKSISFDNHNYYSFDRLLKETGLVLSMHEDKIQKGLRICSQAMRLINTVLPCRLSQNVNYKPKPSSKVLTKGHYRETFFLLRSYYQAEKPNWQGSMDFFGLRNLSKVYELVCLFQIFKSLIKAGAQLEDSKYIELKSTGLPVDVAKPVNEPLNYYSFRLKGGLIELFYEPSIPPYRSAITSETFGLVDVKHSLEDVTKLDCSWVPDFLLIVSKENESKSYHILDAKYSNKQNVNKRDGRLADCVPKYIDGIRKRPTNNMALVDTVDSLHVLYSDNTSIGYKSYYSSVLSLMDNKNNIRQAKALPYIGSIPIQTASSSVLDTLLDHLTG